VGVSVSMEVEIVGSLDRLKKGKKYIGMGMFKDADDVVWQLNKVNGDWVLKRVSSNKDEVRTSRGVKVAGLWREAMVDRIVGKRFAPRIVRGFVDDEARAEVSGKFGSKWIRLVVKEDPLSGEGVIFVQSASDEELIGKTTKFELPDGFKELPDEDKVFVLLSVLGSDEFRDFITLEIGGENETE